MRIVSLLPGVTEILFALDHPPVGVSHECDYPAPATALPSVTRSGVDGSATAEVNAQVDAAMTESGSVFEIDVDRLAELDPDLIVTQGTCAVCAVDASVVHAAVEDIAADPTVLEIDPHTLADVIDSIRRIGDAVAISERTEPFVTDLEDRLDAVRSTIPEGDRPRAAVLDWLDPLMVAGHWVPEVVTFAGGRYGLAKPGNASRIHEWAEVREYDPDVLIAAPCGLGIGETIADIDILTDRPGWDNLSAVRNGNIFAIDGSAYLNRPGPRLVDTVEHLAGLFHPGRFPDPPSDAVQPIPEARRPQPES